MAIATDRPGSARLGGVLTPQALLLAAGLLVAASILTNPPADRVFNGLGGALWVAAAVWLVASLRGQRGAVPILAVALGAALVMAAGIRPGTYPEAVAGFLVAGGLVAFVAPGDGRWALLAPALYFPFHIAIAIGRVVLSGGARSVRTDPPPTEAFVPLAMILAAAVGGAIVARWQAGRGGASLR